MAPKAPSWLKMSRNTSLPLAFCVGAYGEVRKCLHKETKALRAVKIINKKFLEEDEKDKL